MSNGNYRAASNAIQEILNDEGQFTPPYDLAILTLAVLALVDSVDRMHDMLGRHFG